MKLKFSGLAIGNCFVHGRNGDVKKKVSDRKAATVKPTGRVSTRKVKGDPDVEPLETCPLRLLGVGQRKHPDQVVEIGDGNILKRQR